MMPSALLSMMRTSLFKSQSLCTRVCTPAMNLKLFSGPNVLYTHLQAAGIKGYAGQRKPSNNKSRSVKANSRKRNIFLNPEDQGDKKAELLSLYGSSRFNDDDEEEEFSNTSNSPEAIAEAIEETTHQRLSKLQAAHGGQLPPAKNSKIKTAEFIKSSPSIQHCPPAIYPEFAVIGRSNVGKSSLINMLTGRSALAMVSKTPGKTRLINHFLINGAWYLVDLPGYGYARVSKDSIVNWNNFTREYFLERETLCSVLLLIDASIPPMDLDVACATWLAEAEVPYTIVYTKLDKRKKGVPGSEENIAAFEAELLKTWEELPPSVATSSKTGVGKAGLLNHIAQLRAIYHANQK